MVAPCPKKKARNAQLVSAACSVYDVFCFSGWRCWIPVLPGQFHWVDSCQGMRAWDVSLDVRVAWWRLNRFLGGGCPLHESSQPVSGLLTCIIPSLPRLGQDGCLETIGGQSEVSDLLPTPGL